jgi:6-pyruvoyl-tetrahydropterin synthase
MIIKKQSNLMKKILILFSLFLSLSAFGQSFNEDKTSMTNFIKRMYKATPFDGVKIIDDYDHQYLVSVLSMDKAKYTNPSIMNRVAQVKAQSQANTYLNGSNTNMDLVIKTREQKTGEKTETVVESIESIKQNAVGFSQGLELLTNFDDETSKRMVFIFYREIQKTIK